MVLVVQVPTVGVGMVGITMPILSKGMPGGTKVPTTATVEVTLGMLAYLTTDTPSLAIPTSPEPTG